MTEDNKPKLKLKLSLNKDVNVQKLRQAYLESQASQVKTGIKSESKSVSAKFTDEEVKQRLELLKKAEEIDRVKQVAATKLVPEPVIPEIAVVNTGDETEHEHIANVPVDVEPAVELEETIITVSSDSIEAIENAQIAEQKPIESPTLANDLPLPSDIEEKAHKKEVKDKHLEPKKLNSSELLAQLEQGDQDIPLKLRSQAAIKRSRDKLRRQSSNARDNRAKITREVVIGEQITVSDLASLMAEKASDVLRELHKLGISGNANYLLDADTAELLVTTFGHHIKRLKVFGLDSIIQDQTDDEASLLERPPVVTVMGHVDHGKTSLLDALRSSNVALKESGGITQHIGAYRTLLNDGRSITFIDTPGHEAFTAMRGRGAKITDIVILVVAADDGIRPQTIEAIRHAKAADVPIIVAINKIDKPEADAERIRQELLQHDLVAEEFGGEVMMIPISARTGSGLDLLKNSILLLAELMELKANPNTQASGVVIEARIDKAKGIVATLLVQRGCLKVGDVLVGGASYGKVRALHDDQLVSLKQALPSTPVEVLGFNAIPRAGDKFLVVKSDKEARELAQNYQEMLDKQKALAGVSPLSAQEIFMQSLADQKKAKLPIIIKTDTQGSLEAITFTLSKIEHLEVQLQILHSAVGNVSSSDVLLAQASKAFIFGFNVKAAPDAQALAKKNQVEIKNYTVIYSLIDDVKLLLSGLLSPISREQYLGSALVRQVFNLTKSGIIAGSYITKGLAKRGASARLLRDGVAMYEGKIGTLKRFKEDVKEVREGFECGIALEGYDSINIGDVIEIYEVIHEKQYIS